MSSITITSPDILTQSKCMEIVRNRLARENISDFRLISYDVTPSKATGGFMGQYFSLTSTVILGNGSSRALWFFIKAPPTSNTPLGKYNEEYGHFNKEVYIYNDIFPEVFQDLDRFLVPQCYLGVLGRVIIMEDLEKEGFVMLNKMEPLELEHCRLVLISLAKFHAQSMIFEGKSGRNLQKDFSYGLYEILFPKKGKKSLQKYWASVRGLTYLVDLVEEFNVAAKVKFKKTIEEMAEDHMDIVQASEKFRNVLCHGDLWMNNILFRVQSDGIPDRCSLVDFQQMRYTPPAFDILLFLQCCTSREFREKYSIELYKVYHETLSESLINASLKPDEIFPIQDLFESIESYQKSCLFHSILHLPTMLLSAAKVVKEFHDEPDAEFLDRLIFQDRSMLIGSQYSDSEGYRKRLTESLIEFYDKFVA